jgi:hypothetical protein
MIGRMTVHTADTIAEMAVQAAFHTVRTTAIPVLIALEMMDMPV